EVGQLWNRLRDVGDGEAHDPLLLSHIGSGCGRKLRCRRRKKRRLIRERQKGLAALLTRKAALQLGKTRGTQALGQLQIGDQVGRFGVGFGSKRRELLIELCNGDGMRGKGRQGSSEKKKEDCGRTHWHLPQTAGRNPGDSGYSRELDWENGTVVRRSRA